GLQLRADGEALADLIVESRAGYILGRVTHRPLRFLKVVFVLVETQHGLPQGSHGLLWGAWRQRNQAIHGAIDEQDGLVGLPQRPARHCALESLGKLMEWKDRQPLDVRRDAEVDAIELRIIEHRDELARRHQWIDLGLIEGRGVRIVADLP